MKRIFLLLSLIIFFVSTAVAGDLKKLSEYPESVDKEICRMAVPKIIKKRYHLPISGDPEGVHFTKIYLDEFRKCMKTRDCYNIRKCEPKGDYQDNNIDKLLK